MNPEQPDQEVSMLDGRPLDPNDQSHREIDPATGQQKDYIVLSPAERAKGFVRPLRFNYIHRGPTPPGSLRDLTTEERARYAQFEYLKFEEYAEPRGSVVGRFWTLDDLARMQRGCGARTEMTRGIAETYARDPKFYQQTFCVKCRQHFPVAEFVWEGTDEVVGS